MFSSSSFEYDVAYLLDVVIGKSAAILELLAGEDQALLVRWDSLLVLDLGLDIVNGVGGLDLKGDGLARKGLDEAVGVLLVAAIPLPQWARRRRYSLLCGRAGLERLTSALQREFMLAGLLFQQHDDFTVFRNTYFWRRLRRLSMILSLELPTIWQACHEYRRACPKTLSDSADCGADKMSVLLTAT